MKNYFAINIQRISRVVVLSIISGLALLSLAAASTPAETCTGGATVSTANTSTIKMVPVTIPVTTTDVSSQNVFAADFTFTYDPAVLSFVSVTNGTVDPTAEINVNSINPGTLVISAFSGSAFTGAGPLVNVNFNVIGATGGTSPLTLSNFRYNGGAVCTTLTSGTLTIVPSTTTTSVTSSLNPSVFGDTVTFTAHVNSAPPATGGTVNFAFDGLAACTGVALSGGGTATCVTSVLNAGNHVIDATYSGTTDYAGSMGTLAGGQTVNKANQTINFPNPGPHTYGDPDFTVSATATSMLPVSFSSDSPSSCSVTGNLVHILAADFCSIRASQGGNSNYNAAPDTGQTITITKANQTINFPVIPTHTFGDADFTISATATSMLPVSFSSDSPSSCTVTGNLVHIVTAGFCSIRATQAGNGNYNAAPDNGQTFTINKANQTISFPIDPTTRTYGDPDFTVSATATSMLPVSFSSDSPSSCTVTGNLVHIVTAGFCSIRASQGGNINYNPAVDAGQTFTINKANQTISFPIDPSIHTYGDPDFTVSATATSMLPVSFSSDSPATCTVTGNLVHILAAGFCSIRASQGGNINYNPAVDAGQTFTINKANQTISFPIDPTTRTYGDPDFTVSATATSMLPVSFSSDSPATCTVTGNLVHILAAGFCSIRASQGGNTNYNPAVDAGQTFTINKAMATCTVTPYSVPFDTLSHTAMGQCNGVLGQMNLATLNLSGTTHTAPGSYTDTWTFTDVSGNYLNQSAMITDTIISGSVAGQINYAIVTKPVPAVTLTGAGSVPVSGMTDAMGNYLLNNFGAGAYTVTPAKPTQACPGPPNGIFSDDASHVARYVVGLETFEPEQLQAAQVNGLGLPVSSFDAALIAQKVVGICGTAGNRSGQWVFIFPSRMYGSVVGNITGENYLALMRGDVNGDWDPTGPNRPERPTSPEAIQDAIHMAVGSAKSDRGTTVVLPVKINNLRGAGVDAYQFDINYDPRVVTPDSIAADLTGTLSSNMSVVYNVTEPGVLKVAVYGAYPASGDGVYLNLRFVANGKPGASSALHVDNFIVGNGTAATYTYDGQIVINAARVDDTTDGAE